MRECSENPTKQLSKHELILIFLLGLILVLSSLSYLIGKTDLFKDNAITGKAIENSYEESIFSIPYASPQESNSFVRWARIIVASMIFGIGLLIMGSFFYSYKSAQLEYEKDILNLKYTGVINEAIEKAEEDEYSEDMIRKLLLTRIDTSIKTKIKQGLNRIDIKEDLMIIGWPMKLINQRLKEAESKNFKRKIPSIQELDDYIISALRKGHDAKKLADILKKGGWPAELIDTRVSKMKKRQDELLKIKKAASKIYPVLTPEERKIILEKNKNNLLSRT